MISTDRLSEIFVEVADSLVTDFDLQDFLHNLASRTATVSGMSAAGLLLADHHGRLRFMAASSEPAKLLELFQLQNREGPCLDSFEARKPVLAPDLQRARSRWPQFAPRALDVGFQSVHAIPMRLNGQAIGALNLFDTGIAALTESDARVVQALADVATIAIVQERAITRAETLNEQLQSALNSRIVVEQAKGAVAQALGVSVETAFDLLRKHARRHGWRLGDVCRLVLADPERIPQLRTGDE